MNENAAREMEIFLVAADRLGASEPIVRAAGIHAMGALLMGAHPEVEVWGTVLRTLAGFLAGTANDTPVSRTDIAAALSVLKDHLTAPARPVPPLDLSVAQLGGGIDLTGITLPGANFDGADLADAVFDRANLSDCILNGADLSFAGLASTNLARADLRNANLAHANLAGADLSGAVLTNADLTGATFTGAVVDGVTGLAAEQAAALTSSASS